MYSGPEFELYIKIANLIMMNYVAFLYGPGMPIFFILAFVYLFLHYSVERLAMAYFYRKPPMYDNKLNNNTLFLLRLGPILYCLMASWLFSNQQVFRNVVPLVRENVKIVSDPGPEDRHYFKDLFAQLTPATPFLINIVILVIA